ncbi:MAG: hypothetical protein AAF621_00230, partial [Pseudomonadota bacterium]
YKGELLSAIFLYYQSACYTRSKVYKELLEAISSKDYDRQCNLSYEDGKFLEDVQRQFVTERIKVEKLLRNFEKDYPHSHYTNLLLIYGGARAV